MPSEFRSVRVIHNRLSSPFLDRLLHLRGWMELNLAETSGILPSVVSAHLCGKRPIRPQHLAAYLRILDRQERVAFLHAWLRDNVDHDVIANLLEGTKTDSMPSTEENQCRMLDWWATAIVRDSTFAKIFGRFSTKAGSQFPSVLLLQVCTAVGQLQKWLLEKECSVFYFLRSLWARAEQAAVGLVMLILALCQPGKVTQQVGEVAGQAGELAERTLATSLVATSFVAPALAETTDFDSGDRSPSAPETRKDKVERRANAKRSPSRGQRRPQTGPALRVGRTIEHEWRQLVAARKSVHSAFERLINRAHPQESKQKSRKQRRS
jgi:hypothetical protein